MLRVGLGFGLELGLLISPGLRLVPGLGLRLWFELGWVISPGLLLVLGLALGLGLGL